MCKERNAETKETCAKTRASESHSQGQGKDPGSEKVDNSELSPRQGPTNQRNYQECLKNKLGSAVDQSMANHMQTRLILLGVSGDKRSNSQVISCEWSDNKEKLFS